MITLHSVTKQMGRGRHAKRVLDDLSWAIAPRSHYVILGHPGCGKTTLLNIMAGYRFPTRGWVERKGSVCSPRGLIQPTDSGSTPRTLINRLARIYHVSSSELVTFATSFSKLGPMMDKPVSLLPPQLRARLNYGLIYGIPFDFYLFDERIGPPKGEYNDLCTRAYEERCKDASVILTTSKPAIVSKFDGICGVLHAGTITFFDDAKQAVAFFGTLPPPVDFINFDSGDAPAAEISEDEH